MVNELVEARHNNELSRVTGFRILDRKMLTENLVLLRVSIPGMSDRPMTARLKKIDNEWKFDDFDGN